MLCKDSAWSLSRGQWLRKGCGNYPQSHEATDPFSKKQFEMHKIQDHKGHPLYHNARTDLLGSGEDEGPDLTPVAGFGPLASPADLRPVSLQVSNVFLGSLYQEDLRQGKALSPSCH